VFSARRVAVRYFNVANQAPRIARGVRADELADAHRRAVADAIVAIDHALDEPRTSPHDPTDDDLAAMRARLEAMQ
jgi:hypothetical protein